MNNLFEVLLGDVREQLPTLPDNHVQCVITSPPYWGLRKYGEDPREMGSEKTFDEYITNMVKVFEEVRRVLRPDGTLWLNMGDSYAKSGRGGYDKDYIKRKPGYGGVMVKPQKPTGMKAKDLIGQPWAMAFALRAAGWYLRQEIIWAKKNPMPESCTDRPTRAHEQFFLMSKSAKYYYDYEAIKEPGNGSTEKRISQNNFDNQTGGPKDTKSGNRSHRKVLENLKKRIPSGWNTGHAADDKIGRYPNKNTEFKGNNYPTVGGKGAAAGILHSSRYNKGRRESPNSGMFKSHVPGKENSKPSRKEFEREMRASAAERMGRVPGWRKLPQPEKRNKRSVWELSTKPFAEAHYATFPPDLVLPAILAGSRPGDLVMDPFSGAGTVGKVALEKGRRFLGVELYAKNHDITDRRMSNVQPGLALNY